MLKSLSPVDGDVDSRSRSAPPGFRLSTSCTPVDGGTPLPVAAIDASSTGGSDVTTPAAVVAAKL